MTGLYFAAALFVAGLVAQRRAERAERDEPIHVGRPRS